MLVFKTFGQVENQQDKLKALFLYKFTEYVTWPEESEAARIGVLRAPEVLSQLEDFRESRPHLQVVDVKSPADAEGLHVLLLSKASVDQHKDYIKALNGSTTMVVCEDKGDTRWGVDIAFFENNARMSYIVYESSLQRRNLVPSGKLLGLGAR
ncbi:MAG: YfiR family protein [Bacteroidota bacterium]